MRRSYARRVGNQDAVTITCPLCTRSHVYRLHVERSISIGMAFDKAPPERRRSFVRLFPCPVKSEQFEATLTLSETVLNRIESVAVGEAVVDA